MMCERLQAFVDGELDEAAAEAFRDHLAACERCQRESLALMQLGALAEESRAAGAPPKLLDLAAARARRRRTLLVAVPALAAAAALSVLVWRGDGGDGGGGGKPQPVAVALAPQRGVEARLTWAEADRHRPYAVDRAAGGAAESISLAALAELEARGDLVALTGAQLLAGDVARSRAVIEQRPRDADSLADGAALALSAGQPEAALMAADAALELAPGHTQARWNRALALRDLGLEAAAAEAFEAVAAAGEPGWAEEAKARAEALRASLRARQQAWDQANAAGAALWTAGAAEAPPELVETLGWSLRLNLYHALRLAPSRERALSLRPLAEALDRQAGGDVLARLVDRVAAAEFARRAAHARVYQALLAGEASPTRAQLAAMARAGADASDIRLGTLAVLGDPAYAADVAALARELGDPYFVDYAAILEVNGLRAAGRPGEAALRVGSAVATCVAAPRCVMLHKAAAELAIGEDHRPAEALEQARAALRLARQLGYWQFEDTLIFLAADAARFAGEFGLSRALLDELGARAALLGDEAYPCEARRPVRIEAATVEIHRLRFDEALRQARAIPRCQGAVELQAAWVLADLARFGLTPQEVALARADLAAVRADAAAGPGARAIADYVEGRLLLGAGGADAAAARRLLEAAVAAGEAHPDDPDARRARGHALLTLAVAAAEAGDATAALAALARVQGLDAAPGACVLGVAVDDDRVLIAGADAAGAGFAEVARRERPGVDAARLVPESARTRLGGCARIGVLAGATLYGLPLLPPELAWSFLSGPAAAPGVAPASRRRLVVADVLPPAELGLPRLAPHAPDAGAADVTRLSGAAATPARVIAALAGAGLIEIHAHGLARGGSAETARLALSPDAGGRWALTARDLEGVRLQPGALVILAACETTAAAPTLHEVVSLPGAFLAAGAGAVIASATPVADADAPRFFDAVRARIERGQPVAEAVRDERAAWLARDPRSWTAGVLVFER